MVSSEVEVAVDPDTAFTAFTEELDLWWVRGPINHFAGGRVVAVRCEPGVGGRLLEVYEDDVLERGRRSGWPGAARWTTETSTSVSLRPGLAAWSGWRPASRPAATTGAGRRG